MWLSGWWASQLHCRGGTYVFAGRLQAAYALHGALVTHSASPKSHPLQGKGGRAAAAGRGSRQPSTTAEAAAPAEPRSKSAEMFAHLPQPRGVTLQSCASQRGPPGEGGGWESRLQWRCGVMKGGGPSLLNSGHHEPAVPSTAQLAIRITPRLHIVSASS